MITPNIETERLIIKRGNINDYIRVYEFDFTRIRNIDGEFELVKLDPNLVKGFETYADEVEDCMDFILYIKDSMSPIGNITYDKYIDINKSIEISYNLHPNYWKKGYMTEAVIATMSYIFNEIDIDNIRCRYAQDNINSCSLNEKIGFKKVGSHKEYYKRLKKYITEIDTIISKEDFLSKYANDLLYKIKI